ncbi:GNAT family N-acetyltransferase [Peptoniphilus sp. KCTC 25270]|uniref:GNAT family N-acetyltransferase n=1 Tax=Peptoniphilus sp. KCTC 25270 TaxID=2897414 RepID=UPI001E28E7C9|nr:GNAT family N-acetyltransferase [Peptoniphilus sp. KCTC 25270]MCD1147377.1 GNAT family N-acetyltransferase [Peptoniphilus sp. KCTC 25270]
MAIYAKPIPYAGEEYDRLLKIRNRLIYKPWNKDVNQEVQYSDIESYFYGLYDDGLLIGGASYRYLPEEIIRIQDIAIEPTYQGRGHGSALLSFVEAHLDKEDTKTIVLESRRSVMPFFEKNGYEFEAKTETETDVLLLRMEKDYKKRETRNHLPLFEEKQMNPIALVTLKNDGYTLLSEIRKSFPQEDVFVIELLEDNDMWLNFAENTLHGGFKYSVISPLLYAPGRFNMEESVNLPEELAKKALDLSENKKILLLAPPKVLENGVFEKSLMDLDSSVHLTMMEFEVPYVDSFAGLDSPFYHSVAEKLEDLKEIDFDTVLLPSFQSGLDLRDIQQYLEDSLNRELKIVPVNDVVVRSLRYGMMDKNLSNILGGTGELVLYSQDEKGVRERLKKYHRGERSAKIFPIVE